MATDAVPNYSTYRIDVTKNVGANYWCIQELKFYGENANRIATPASGASAETIHAGAFKAFNEVSNNDESYYCSKTGVKTGWLQFDFGIKTKISSYEIEQINGYANQYSPVDWKFEGSNDGNTWVTLDEQSGHNTWNDGEIKSFKLITTVTCPQSLDAVSTTCVCGISDCGVGKYCFENACTATPPACTVSLSVATGKKCDCSGNTCITTEYCYGGTCNDKAAIACVVDYTETITEKCYKLGNENEFCPVDKLYYAEDCQDAACTASLPKDVFYGSKLRGQWDSDSRKMNMNIKTPHDVSITEISWRDAVSNDLKYSSAGNGRWTIDATSEPCYKKYVLNVAQSDFFGDGSKFTLTGSQLKTQLNVKATQWLSEVKLGTTYKYDRAISNVVPAIVNLQTTSTFTATFKIAHVEGETLFVFFRGASENVDTDSKSVELDLEIHSSNCVNNALTDSTYTAGTRIKTGNDNLMSKNNSTFTWGTETGTLDPNDLCIQTLTWDFTPKASLVGGQYDMVLEFMSKGGKKHEATATINIQQADVLDDIGFGGTMVLYEEKECLNTKEKYYIGDHFFAKISLTNLIINAATIGCTEFDVTQTNPTTNAVEPTDLKADKLYDYQEYNLTDVNGALVANTRVCSAELQSPHFHRTDEGYQSILTAKVQIEYETDLGTMTRRMLRFELGIGDQPVTHKEMALGEEASVGQNEEDAYYARKGHDSESKDLSVEMSILKNMNPIIENLNPFKTMETSKQDGSISKIYEKYTKFIIICSVALLGGILLAGRVQKTKASSIDASFALMQEEEL